MDKFTPLDKNFTLPPAVTNLTAVSPHPITPVVVVVVVVVAGLLQMIIRMGWPFANDHPDGPTICK